MKTIAYFLASGRVSSRVTIDTRKNHTSCSQNGAPSMDETMAASAPRANQMETSPGASPSMTSRIIADASHSTVMLTGKDTFNMAPPFRGSSSPGFLSSLL